MKQWKYDVFISYSRKDYVDEHKNVIPGNEVSKIKESLTEAGITFWFDENGIYHGDEFTGVIADAIDESSLFVFISSKHSNDSNWTLGEIATAQEANKKIIPVRIDSARYHKSLRVRLNALDYIDYKTNQEKGRQELVQSINAYLEEARTFDSQKKANEKRKQEELDCQRKKQEEEKKKHEQITKIEAEIAALEPLKTEREKTVLQKEQELKIAQVDLKACEEKIQKMQKKIQEIRALQINEGKAEEHRIAEKRKHEAAQKTETEQMHQDKEDWATEKTFTVGDVSFKMIHVEGGSFMMGSSDNDSSAFDDEKPLHRVTLSDYYIGETQVTQGLWKAVMGDNPSNWKKDSLPVEKVSWEDCLEFIKHLNKKSGKTFRLPTEAEWEYAARGGRKSQGLMYAGCNNIDKVAWHDGNSGSKTHPVKQKSSNELGLYDMSGNVWEWCQDWFGDYIGSAQTNPTGPSSGSSRVLRGGSWYRSAVYCRVSSRHDYDSSLRSGSFGFRLALGASSYSESTPYQ